MDSRQTVASRQNRQLLRDLEKHGTHVPLRSTTGVERRIWVEALASKDQPSLQWQASPRHPQQRVYRS